MLVGTASATGDMAGASGSLSKLSEYVSRTGDAGAPGHAVPSTAPPPAVPPSVVGGSTGADMSVSTVLAVSRAGNASGRMPGSDSIVSGAAVS